MDNKVIFFCELIKSVIHTDNHCCLNDDVDWPYMVRLAKEHSLFPIFVEGAVKHPSYLARTQYALEMQDTLTIVAAQIKRTNAFLKLYDAFTKEGIYPILMKGLICRELYGKLADHRPSGDEDILIRLSEYWKAKEILVANGYVSEFDSETEAQLERMQEVSFFHPTEKLQIELHLNPMGRENEIRSLMSDCFMNVFDNYREVEYNGVRVRTMNHKEHFLFLILHAFKHFTGGGFGIRQMLDILLYQERYGMEINMKWLQETLRGFKADVFCSDLIHLGNSYFGFKLPVFQPPNCPNQLLDDMILCGSFGNKTQAERTAMGTIINATENSLTNKKSNTIVMIFKSIFPSRVYLINHYPYLEEKPWLLPFEWIKRWGRFVKHNRNNEGNLVVESVKISRRRIKLLKKYDLV